MDQRMVGSAMRRRIGAPSSHLGMAGNGDKNPGQKEALMGGRSSGDDDIPGVAVGWKDPNVLNPDNNEFASAVSSSQENEPHPPRTQIDSSGARLTVSPSMKIAEESPAPTQGQGRIVQSRPGRSFSTFNEGAQEERDA